MRTTLPASILTLLCTVSFFLNGCTKQVSDIILADIGPEKLTVAEYERQLSKNNGGWEAAKSLPIEEKEKFLDLLVKFRLKLLDAYQRGLDKDPEVVNEMQEYRSSLATSYFLDKVVVTPGLRLMYERRKEELRASHILFRLPRVPTPEDTLTAWQKADAVLKQANAGEDFAKLAGQFSEDRSSSEKGGDVYYFTSGATVPRFEDACYELQPGRIYPMPVRTRFGYHVIKLTDRRPNRGQVRASHIMIRFDSSSPQDTLKAYNTIRALQDSLKAGIDFADLAKRHSQHAGSAAAGGDLGFFERRRGAEPFDEAAFSLRVGEVSGIVKTSYGYHLIKVTDEKPLGSFEEMKTALREQYQNTRYTYDYENYLQDYKAAVGFRFSEDVVDTLLSRSDSAKTSADSLWDRDIPKRIREKPVFFFAADSVSLDSVIEIMKKDPEFNNTQLKSDNIRKTLDRIAERSLMRYRTRNIEAEYPEFKQTLKEYEEGVLLYKSEQRHVWDKISTSDSLLRDFYEKHRERYTTVDSVNIREIYVSKDSSKALQLLDSLKAGVDFGDLASRHTERPNLRKAKGEWGYHAASESDLTRTAWSMEIGQVSGVLRYPPGYSIISVIGKEKSRFKTFEEALPELAGHYHDETASRLEEEWLNMLRKQFKVVVWKEKLTDTFVKPPQEKTE
jgi:peptidyl-prolyl cis-trans isomerase SurA